MSARLIGSLEIVLPVHGGSIVVNGYKVRVSCPACRREHVITTIGARGELEASLASGSVCPACEHKRRDRGT